jgi:NAD(P)H-dependent flavin oxidoreductase YrpB (nitropropane dioxygenase family)/DNA-binding MarR family transcriptional regulator
VDKIDRINQTLVQLFNLVLKLEEKALKESTFRNLSITEVHTLAAITENQTKTMTQVANELGISVSTLTTAINRLVQKGYVHRFRVEEDRRIVKIQLTESGKSALREHEAFHIAMVSDALKTLSPEEIDRFSGTMDGLMSFLMIRKTREEFGSYPQKLNALQLGDLDIPVPLFQGAMGIGFSLHQLASAVAMRGGAGTIAATQIGWREPDYMNSPLEANLRALEKEVKEARRRVEGIHGRGPIGVNVLVPSKGYEAYVRKSVEAGAEFIVSSGGLPIALPSYVENPKVKLIPVVSSYRAANLIIKSWQKKYRRLPDAFILEGPHAGAHLGLSMNQVVDSGVDFYHVVGSFKKELAAFPSIKLIVSGGIKGWEEATTYLSMGADGIQLGTRFLTTVECDMNSSVKKTYLDLEKKQITVMESPLRMPARVLKNKLIQDVETGVRKEFQCDYCLSNCMGSESTFCVKDALIRTANGDVDQGLLYIGAGGGEVKALESVQDIFKEFTEKSGD